jgi:hypothetical protein
VAAEGDGLVRDAERTNTNVTDHPTGDGDREPEDAPPAPREEPEPAVPVRPEMEPWEEDDEADFGVGPLGGDGPGWGDGVPPELPPARRSRGGAAVTGVLVLLLSLGLVACGAWAVKLQHDKATMAANLDRTLALIAQGAPPEVGTQLATARTELAAGKLGAVGDALTELSAQVQKVKGSGGVEGLPPGPLPESAYKELPAEAATFFRQHEDLLKRLLVMSNRARELRDSGANVDALRKVRDSTIEAARLGQLDKVQAHLATMDRMLGGGGSPQARTKLRSKVMAFQQAAQQAMRQGRDPRRAVAFARQAEEAAQAGDLAKADQLLDQAISGARKAPRGRGPGPPGWGRGRLAQANPLAGLLRVVMQVMSLEERDLANVWGQLTKLGHDLRGPEPDRQPPALLPLVDTAMQSLQTIGGRRKELTLRIRGNRRPAAGRPAQGPNLGQINTVTEAQREQLRAIMRNRLVPLLDQLRALPAADYLTSQDRIIRDLVRAVYQPPTREELAVGPPPTAAQQRQAQADRIRAKMLKGSTVLQQQEIAGQDTTAVEDLFSRARQALYASDLNLAEQLVDRALTQLGISLDQFGPKPPAAPGSALSQPDAGRLDITPRRGSAPGGTPAN